MVWIKTGAQAGQDLGEVAEHVSRQETSLYITECISSMRRDVAVAATAATSRLATLALMALFDGVFADYDTSARQHAGPGEG